MTDNRVLQAVLDKVTSLEQKVNEGFKEVFARFDKMDKRIDNLGMQLANLEDDAPTNEAFDEVVERVEKLEHKFAVLQK